MSGTVACGYVRRNATAQPPKTATIPGCSRPGPVVVADRPGGDPEKDLFLPVRASAGRQKVFCRLSGPPPADKIAFVTRTRLRSTGKRSFFACPRLRRPAKDLLSPGGGFRPPKRAVVLPEISSEPVKLQTVAAFSTVLRYFRWNGGWMNRMGTGKTYLWSVAGACNHRVAQPSPAAGSGTVPVRVSQPLAAGRRHNPQPGRLTVSRRLGIQPIHFVCWLLHFTV